VKTPTVANGSSGQCEIMFELEKAGNFTEAL